MNDVYHGKKRGRKGNKIELAFLGIPLRPTDAIAYASAHGISLHVLRQAKRFDCEGGLVMVKKAKATKQLNVWRSI